MKEERGADQVPMPAVPRVCQRALASAVQALLPDVPWGLYSATTPDADFRDAVASFCFWSTQNGSRSDFVDLRYADMSRREIFLDVCFCSDQLEQRGMIRNAIACVTRLPGQTDAVKAGALVLYACMAWLGDQRSTDGRRLCSVLSQADTFAIKNELDETLMGRALVEAFHAGYVYWEIDR